MEIFELRYFLAVAAVENVNQAAKAANVSAGSLSKAVARLEDELQTPLFYKVGRGIRLTQEGKYLKRKAAEILALEESVRIDFRGNDLGSVNITVAGEEILLATFGVRLVSLIRSVLPSARFQTYPTDDGTLMDRLSDGAVHLALTTQEVPKDFAVRTFGDVTFQNCASAQHPLLKGRPSSARGLTFPIEEILQHSFVVPGPSLLGRIKGGHGSDGWRDDKFPRHIVFRSGSVSIAESLVKQGLALGYLPDHRIESAGLISLSITGCPYVCRQKVKLAAKNPENLGWLNRLWSLIQ